jgi:hypothetical protein
MRRRLPNGFSLLTLFFLGVSATTLAQSRAPGTEFALSLPGCSASVPMPKCTICESQNPEGDWRLRQLFQEPSSSCPRPGPPGNTSFMVSPRNSREFVSEGSLDSDLWCAQRPLASQGGAAASSGSVGIKVRSPQQFVGDVLQDQKRTWKFPWEVVHGHHWKPALAFTLATASLVELDPHDTPYFRRTQSFAGFNHSFSSTNTGLGEGLFPVAFFLAGHLHRDTYAENTALLAGEALADAEIVSEVMKNVDRRLRPREIPPNGDFAHTWFKAGGGILINRGSFPSGHAIGAFAMATVIAERYRQHRWVPWVAYGIASVVGFSRITLQAHFPSDIFAGAALGYAISHYVVLRTR